MKFLGVIPSRYASSRFPGKSLAVIGEKTMIQRVYEQASKAKYLDAVVVATDDNAIANHVKSFGGQVIMTSEKHPSGTDRVNEAVEIYGNDFQVIVNIQGDEPFIDPQQIDTLAEQFQDEEIQIATMAKKIEDESDIFNENVVKVVSATDGKALYFSRSPIPFVRSVEKTNWKKRFDFFKHIGIYAYRTEVLGDIVKLPLSRLERAESLEQLRWLEAGYHIQVVETDFENIGIDTYDDLNKVKQFLEKQQDENQ